MDHPHAAPPLQRQVGFGAARSLPGRPPTYILDYPEEAARGAHPGRGMARSVHTPVSSFAVRHHCGMTSTTLTTLFGTSLLYAYPIAVRSLNTALVVVVISAGGDI